VRLKILSEGKKKKKLIKEKIKRKKRLMRPLSIEPVTSLDKMQSGLLLGNFISPVMCTINRLKKLSEKHISMITSPW
jgi:hypothetical protein